MKKKWFQNHKWTKWISFFGLTSLICGSLAGLGVGIANFVTRGSSNKGTNFDDSIEIKININLDRNLTDEENLKVVEDVSNKITFQTQKLGVNSIEVKSSIEYLPISIQDNISNIPYGSIRVYTEKYIPGIAINYDSGNYVNDFLQKLSLYYALSNPYSLSLENVNVNNGLIINNNNINFDKTYQINNDISKATINKENIDMKLRNSANEISGWNLDNMQDQFTNVYKWDGEQERQYISDSTLGDSSEKSTTTQSLIQTYDDSSSDGSDSTTEPVIKEIPKESYIFWINRTGFINRLQFLATIGYLKYRVNINSNDFIEESRPSDDSEFNPNNDPYKNQITTINNLYNSITNSDEIAFMDWAGNKTNYVGAMEFLYYANQQDYGIDRSVDPLIKLLKDFFSSNEYKNSEKAISFESADIYEFLYSWNVEKIDLFSGWMYTIDYNNFFYFFSDNTDNPDNDLEITKTTYSSDSFSVKTEFVDPSVSNANYLIDSLNNGSYDETVIIPELLNNTLNSNINSQEIYSSLITYMNNIVFEYPNYLSNSITHLSAFNGSLVGVSVLLLVIGIIVSLLYKVPGVLGFIASLFSFGLSLIMMTSLNSIYSISSFLSLLIGVITMFLPIINSQNSLRNAIRYKKFNIFNSFVYSIKKFIKISIATFIPAVLISLVFLFFGKYRINELGSSLILVMFANIIAIGFIFLIMYSISYYLYFKNKPNLLVNASYVKKLDSLRFFNDNQNDVLISNSLIDKSINNLFNSSNFVKKLIWSLPILIIVLAVIGCVLLATIGPGYSQYFHYSTEIIINFNSADANGVEQFINAMSAENNLTWLSQELINNVYKNGNGDWISQIILISKNNMNVNQIMEWVLNNHIRLDSNAINPTTLWNINIEDISYTTNNPYISNLLLTNAVNCMFISLAFLIIFSIVFFNIINFLPIFLISCFNIFISFGIINLLRIPVDINSIVVWLFVFTLSTIIIYNIYTELLFEFNKKENYTYKQIITKNIEQLRQNIKSSLYIIFSSLVYGLGIMLFISVEFIFNQLILFICILLLYFIICMLSLLFFSISMYLREIYLANVRKNKRNIDNKVIYDKVDEQAVIGINHFN